MEKSRLYGTIHPLAPFELSTRVLILSNFRHMYTIEFFQKSSLNSMNSLKIFHVYVNELFMVTLLLLISFYGNLTIINQFLW